MFAFQRKALAGIGVTAAAVASTALFAAPAQAASAGVAKVVGTSTIQFNALKGKTNSLVITISGRTITLDDKVAIKPGKGCKAVKRDKTKVKCTTKKKATQLRIALGDKNDTVTNKTAVPMLADGGAGNDVLNGGSGKDQLQGAAGNDRIHGRAGNDLVDAGIGNDSVHGDAGKDSILGGAGNDRIVGGSGNDLVDAGAGNDLVYGEAGNDSVLGGAGNDRLNGQVGNDVVSGDGGDDTISGGFGDDELFGDDGNYTISDGNDTISGGEGDDLVRGYAGDDQLDGGAGNDIAFGDEGNDLIFGGPGYDWAWGLAGDDQIFGGADDDALIGESLRGGENPSENPPMGDDSALDKLDGGPHALHGDICLVMAAGTTTNCERSQDPSHSMADVPPRVSDAIKSIDKAKALPRPTFTLTIK